MFKTTIAAVATLVLAAAATQADEPRYRAIMLEQLDGGSIVEALTLNNAGIVGGQAGTGAVDPGQHAVIWVDGEVMDLDPAFDLSAVEVINDSGTTAGTGWDCPPGDGACPGDIARATPGGAFVSVGNMGGLNSIAADINSAGDVVGWGYDEDFNPRAYVFTELLGLVDLGTLGGPQSEATAINDAGVIAGFSRTRTFTQRAFVWQDGVMSDLGTLGGVASAATDMNEGGVIVGWADAADGAQHAFQSPLGEALEDIQTIPAAMNSQASVVNDAGVIGGVWSDGATERLFVFTADTGMIDLGVPAGVEDDFDPFNGPAAINADGQMVGTGLTNLYEPKAWIASETLGVQLLADLIVGDEIVVTSAVAINDKGEIAANGYDPVTSEQRAALLVPVAPADLDADGAVNGADLVLLLGAWGPCADEPCIADINGDGEVNGADLVILLGSWG